MNIDPTSITEKNRPQKPLNKIHIVPIAITRTPFHTPIPIYTLETSLDEIEPAIPIQEPVT